MRTSSAHLPPGFEVEIARGAVAQVERDVLAAHVLRCDTCATILERALDRPDATAGRTTTPPGSVSHGLLQTTLSALARTAATAWTLPAASDVTPAAIGISAGEVVVPLTNGGVQVLAWEMELVPGTDASRASLALDVADAIRPGDRVRAGLTLSLSIGDRKVVASVLDGRGEVDLTPFLVGGQESSATVVSAGLQVTRVGNAPGGTAERGQGREEDAGR